MCLCRLSVGSSRSSRSYIGNCHFSWRVCGIFLEIFDVSLAPDGIVGTWWIWFFYTHSFVVDISCGIQCSLLIFSVFHLITNGSKMSYNLD